MDKDEENQNLKFVRSSTGIGFWKIICFLHILLLLIRCLHVDKVTLLIASFQMVCKSEDFRLAYFDHQSTSSFNLVTTRTRWVEYAHVQQVLNPIYYQLDVQICLAVIITML